MSATILFKNNWIEFSRDDSGEHFLTVLCGGIGMYERRVRLTPEELAFIRDYGDFYIEKIAADISHEPERFTDRFLPVA